MDGGSKMWIDEELANSKLSDKRLKKRLVRITEQISANIGETIPNACEDWANTKAAYRFFSNPNVTESQILEGHFHSTARRSIDKKGPLLVLHDTTEVNYTQRKDEAFGSTRMLPQNPRSEGGRVSKAICGVLMHSSLVITPSGLPLGFAAKKFWNRKIFKGIRKIHPGKNATRIPLEEKESFRWIDSLKNATERLGNPDRLVHIGDREADIYEFFHEADRLRTNYLVRIKVDRKLAPKLLTLRQEIENSEIKGIGQINCTDKDGSKIKVTLEIKFIKATIIPSDGIKRKRYGSRDVTVIQAKEISECKGDREQIDWRIITNLHVPDLESAVEKLHWYSLRWKIETFFKVLKSGFNIDHSKIKSAESICKLMSISCIVAWRVFWMTMLIREDSAAPPNAALTETEMQILDNTVPDRGKHKSTSLSDYLLKIAKLGGYLARKSDLPPGNTVVWRGLKKLIELQRGFEIAKELVGN